MTTIAEILHLAADKYLWDGLTHRSIYDICYPKDYSCNAIASACCDTGYNFNTILIGLKNMGLSTRSMSAFSEFNYGYERQQARYVWLKFAAMQAEEQGV